jgi:hypothetical protein
VDAPGWARHTPLGGSHERREGAQARRRVSARALASGALATCSSMSDWAATAIAAGAALLGSALTAIAASPLLRQLEVYGYAVHRCVARRRVTPPPPRISQ